MAQTMHRLHWDDGLALLAQHRASICESGHPSPGATTDFWDNEHGKDNKTFIILEGEKPQIGENTAIFQQNPPITEYTIDLFNITIDAFVNEQRWFDWNLMTCNAPSGGVCGHWLQVVNHHTRYVGCAFQECPAIHNELSNPYYADGGLVFVCNYFPAYIPTDDIHTPNVCVFFI